ncbi:TraR/DksA C4-type zinc finger protein [Frankia sp. AiPs1]|uniref:TraR/DksA family transcriptional regulator n=1 Tax=Frankia sp. AiPs1 TaxID=573493 RepID=UPI0020434CE7|nr:TraR/DksA C4-type zinc finger protein [Frankia sp. AiPs1]MCM3920686.1 TraR/DksA C4-type zinc finger protein [Frankia sp. AiPs1]
MTAETDVRAELLAERLDAATRVAALRDGLDRILDDTADRDADDEHDIEGASMPFEREQVRATLRQATDRLAEVDAALGRLAAGTYGVCETCGRTVGEQRLAARPSARTCLPCATRRPRHR